MSRFAHFTTLVPVELEKQLERLKTWHLAYGASVHTVNHTREYELLKPCLPDWVIPIEVRFAQSFGRDYIPLNVLRKAILARILSETSRVVIANSDIGLDRPEVLIELDNARYDLVFASRNDVDVSGQPAGRYSKGYDVFALSPSALSCLEINGVFLGMPWWDYIVPLVALLEGRTVRRLDSDAFHHVIHPQRWSVVAFDHIGWQLMRRVLPEGFLAGEPTHARVLAFAKVTNSFLNSDLLLAPDLSPRQLRELFLARLAGSDAVSLAGELSTVSGDQATARSAGRARQIEIHGKLLELYRSAKDGDTPALRLKMSRLAGEIYDSNEPAWQKTYERYARLIGLRLGCPDFAKRLIRNTI